MVNRGIALSQRSASCIHPRRAAMCRANQQPVRKSSTVKRTRQSHVAGVESVNHSNGRNHWWQSVCCVGHTFGWHTTTCGSNGTAVCGTVRSGGQPPGGLVLGNGGTRLTVLNASANWAGPRTARNGRALNLGGVAVQRSRLPVLLQAVCCSWLWGSGSC